MFLNCVKKCIFVVKIRNVIKCTLIFMKRSSLYMCCRIYICVIYVLQKWTLNIGSKMVFLHQCAFATSMVLASSKLKFRPPFFEEKSSVKDMYAPYHVSHVMCLLKHAFQYQYYLEPVVSNILTHLSAKHCLISYSLFNF